MEKYHNAGAPECGSDEEAETEPVDGASSVGGDVVTGWAVFYAFGAHAKDPLGASNTSSLLLAKDPSKGDKRASWRAAQRQKLAALSDAERAAGSTNGKSGTRGIAFGGTMQDAASIAQRREDSRLRQNDNMIFALSEAVKSKQTRADWLFKKLALPCFAQNNEKQEEFLREIERLEFDLQDLETQLRQLAQQGPQSVTQVDAFLSHFVDLSQTPDTTPSSKRPRPSSAPLRTTPADSEDDA